MSRERKDARALNIKLATPEYDQLDKFCNETGMNKTEAIEQILGRFFGVYFARPERERLFNAFLNGASV